MDQLEQEESADQGVPLVNLEGQGLVAFQDCKVNRDPRVRRVRRGRLESRSQCHNQWSKAVREPPGNQGCVVRWAWRDLLARGEHQENEGQKEDVECQGNLAPQEAPAGKVCQAGLANQESLGKLADLAASTAKKTCVRSAPPC